MSNCKRCQKLRIRACQLVFCSVSFYISTSGCVVVEHNEFAFYQTFLIGYKIKALRAKTNTYIKTPVRGEEPVFVVTGRKEDVALAKAEILSAADHFSQVPYFIQINQKYIDRFILFLVCMNYFDLHYVKSIF